MQVLNDIWESVKGNVKTRVNDPIIGAFVISWCLFNWDRLAMLFWGSGKLDERISIMSKDMAFIDSPSLLWTNFDLLLLPLTATVFYIFLLPLLAHFVDENLRTINVKRHEYAIETDINKAKKQKELNKARLRANQNYEFLAQEAKIDIEREKSEAEIKHADAEIAKNKQIESKAKATAAEIELEKREQQAETEKRTLAISTAKQKAELASHKFPSAYLFIELLSDSLKANDLVMPLSGLTSCVASVFGYKDFNELLKDKKFTNENLELMIYVILDTDRLTSEFTTILDDEYIEEYDSKVLIEHFEMIFDELPYKLIYPETLAERILDKIDENSFELLTIEGVCDGMAETDTIFEEVNEIVLDKYLYDSDRSEFIINLSGSASGYHRKESDIPGRGIDISIEASCRAIIGKYGLQEHSLMAHATPTDYD
jgi:hypothetical protein